MNSPSPDRFADTRSIHVVVFTSPKAGRGSKRDQLPRLVQLLETRSIDCDVTESVAELERLVSQSRPNREVIVVTAGGDGTLSLAASTLAITGEMADVPLVPMPMGTENLLARHFGHKTDAASVVETIRSGSVYQLDVGIANGKPFLVMATCGFDAEVVRAMHLTRTGHISRFSYFGPILRAMRRYTFPKLQVRIDDGDPIECCWAMAFNLPQYAGGLRIEPDAVGNDGLLDVILFRGGSIPSGLKYVSGIWLRRHLRFRDVRRFRGQRIDITCEERIPFQLDGDYAGRLPLRITTMPGKIRLLLPPQRS